MKKNPIKANIEIRYDYFLSSVYFEDDFTHSPLDISRDWYLWQYIRSGETEVADYMEDLIEIDTTNTRTKLYKFLGWTYSEAKDYTIQELRTQILDGHNSYEDLDYLEENLSIKRKFYNFETRGYSQGDYAKVIVLDKDYFEGIETYIDNLFWDSLISGRIELWTEEGWSEEIELYELDIPEYLNYPQDIDWINDKIIEYIKDKYKNVGAKDNILKAIKEALPNKIEYPRSC